MLFVSVHVCIFFFLRKLQILRQRHDPELIEPKYATVLMTRNSPKRDFAKPHQGIITNKRIFNRQWLRRAILRLCSRVGLGDHPKPTLMNFQKPRATVLANIPNRISEIKRLNYLFNRCSHVLRVLRRFCFCAGGHPKPNFENYATLLFVVSRCLHVLRALQRFCFCVGGHPKPNFQNLAT